MSSRIEKIQTLVELAEVEESKALETFSTLQGQYQQHIQQLDTLQNYVNDYAHQSSDGSTTTVQILTTHAFVGKLHQAIQLEQSKTEEFKNVMELAREAWIEKRARLQALQKLLLKLQQNHQIRLEKQEQRFLDELSSQSYSRINQKT